MDYSKLKGLMREKGYTQAELARAIGISESTLNLKLSGKSFFKADEILKISSVLDIMRPLDDYFFCK